jgi:hypothetical protein
MSDPFLDHLHNQRLARAQEMANCPQCKVYQGSAPTIDHLMDHRRLSLVKPESDADIEYSHDAPVAQYPYKSKGMDDADKMHPKKWKAK